MLRKQNWQVFVIKGERGGGFRETFQVSDLDNWWMVVIFIWQGRERQNCGERGLVLDTQESPVGNSNVESGESHWNIDSIEAIGLNETTQKEYIGWGVGRRLDLEEHQRQR